jgi:HTH-type transcriptional regulator/antitoxin HigA
MAGSNPNNPMRAIKALKTEQDYSAALARTASLMQAPAGTPEGDELEVLVTLIEAYEAKHHAIDPPHPVDAIKFRMEHAGLSQQDLVPLIGSRSKVSEVLSGKRALNIRMIRALHEGLGIPLASLVGKETAGASQPSDDLLKHVPVAEMAKRGWFAEFNGNGHAARAAAPVLLPKFFGSIDLAALELCLHRRTPARNSTANPAALMAWQTRVLEIAATAKLPAFDPQAITPDFARQLVGFSMLESGPIAAGEFLAKHGIALVVLSHLPRTHLDGSATRLKSGTPVIGLTLRHDRLDNFWFTLLHEVGHVALHLNDGETSTFLDDLDEPGTRDARELEANAFASEALIPTDEWRRAKLVHAAKSAEVLALSHRLRIHVAIVAGRVRRELGDFRKLSKFVGSGEVRRLFPQVGRGMHVDT